MRKTFAFNQDRQLKSNYGNQQKKIAPVVKIRKPIPPEQSHQDATKRNRRFVYKYILSDGSKGNWITEINPRHAGFELPLRFPGRKVISIEWMNK